MPDRRGRHVRGQRAQADDGFWANPSAAHQAAEQGVGPITSVEAFAAPDVFTDEEIEGFIATIRESRSEG